jgi:hypothetical protein
MKFPTVRGIEPRPPHRCSAPGGKLKVATNNERERERSKEKIRCWCRGFPSDYFGSDNSGN